MLDVMVTEEKLSPYPLPLEDISRAGDTSKRSNDGICKDRRCFDADTFAPWVLTMT